MEEIDKKLAALQSRCSREALVTLMILRKHELFEELLSQLEQFTGRVSLRDLERMFCGMQRSKPRT